MLMDGEEILSKSTNQLFNKKFYIHVQWLYISIWYIIRSP